MEITTQQQKDIKGVADKYDLSLVVLFGSAATGQTHKNSDVDIALKSHRALELMDEARLNGEFCRIFRRNDVDVVNLAHAQPLLMKQIADQGIVLYASQPGLFERFVLYALQRYAEAKPLFEMNEAAVRAFVRS